MERELVEALDAGEKQASTAEGGGRLAGEHQGRSTSVKIQRLQLRIVFLF
jgi:hypothetical protein